MTDRKAIEQAAVEAAARAGADALGDTFEDAFANKAEWIAERGERGGRFRDINEPFRSDYDEAAQAAIAAYLATMREAGFVMVMFDNDMAVTLRTHLGLGTFDRYPNVENAVRAMIAASD